MTELDWSGLALAGISIIMLVLFSSWHEAKSELVEERKKSAELKDKLSNSVNKCEGSDCSQIYNEEDDDFDIKLIMKIKMICRTNECDWEDLNAAEFRGIDHYLNGVRKYESKIFKLMCVISKIKDEFYYAMASGEIIGSLVKCDDVERAKLLLENVDDEFLRDRILDANPILIEE